MTDAINQARELIIAKSAISKKCRERFNRILSGKLADAVIEAEEEYKRTSYKREKNGN